MAKNAAKTNPKPDDDKSDTKSVGTTKAQEKRLPELPTISARIRYLDAEGYSRSQIRHILGLKHYQHVRNVLTTKVKNPRT